jgi:hypothetical protein
MQLVNSRARSKLALLGIDQFRRRRKRRSGAPPVDRSGLIRDSFNRANGPIGSADTGQAWIPFDTSFIVQDGRAKRTAGTTFQTAYIDDGETDGAFKAIQSVAGQGGIMMRRVNSNTFIATRVASGLIRLIRQTASATSTIGTGGAVDGGEEIKVVISGNSFSVYVNDIFQFTSTETQGNTSTQHGITFQNAVAQLDNFAHLEP